MVIAQLSIGNASLFCGIVGGVVDILQQPLVAGGGGEHAAHQVIAAVGVGKGVQRVMGVHPEVFRGDENRS